MEILYFTSPLTVMPPKIGSDGGVGLSHGAGGGAINHGDARLPKTKPTFANSHQDPGMTTKD